MKVSYKFNWKCEKAPKQVVLSQICQWNPKTLEVKKTDINPNKTRFIPVPDWNKHHGWPALGGLRNLIFNRKTNGLDKFKVIKKIGKRVLIDEAAFFEWVKSHD